MDKQQLMAFITMTFSKRFIQLRKEHQFTQQEMADKVGMHITQVRRYESDQSQPSIEILKKIAVAFNVTTDWLIFEDDERELPNNLQLKFEAVTQLPEDEQRVIESLIDGMIVKHQTKQLVSGINT
ncbi:helix-turn-helix domain-containing protein [Marinibactrum halimedae]|uniref:HTH cro/C1-type domain-containing protein n=1 Tax=Marinibactrum halimedae TaxID=1444977 RepID=A0AA37T9Z8_9GAMM|nr:helix-turn-helix transcriptional regulator [Marinibactrum halimedae]MCD9461347.1 helix-turn-helix domain-containing protein [Marinibactrum halimedae]GLS28284.1 hypothetical protein GCM10007877_40030 [Marinibactrum halimedae]